MNTLKNKHFEELKGFLLKYLPENSIKPWREKVNEAAKGKDLSLVWPKFAVWLLVDSKFGVLQFVRNRKEKKAIKHVADLYSKVIRGEKITQQTWGKITDKAWDAYVYAAADAAYASWNAAAAARAAGETRAYIAQAEKLLELLEETPMLHDEKRADMFDDGPLELLG